MRLMRKTITSKGVPISYFVGRFDRFSLCRLRAELGFAVRDFAHFRNAIRDEKKVIVGAQDIPLDQLSVPDFMMRDLGGRIDFVAFRALVSAWVPYYLAATGEGPGMCDMDRLDRDRLVACFEDWRRNGRIVLDTGTPSTPSTGVITAGTFGYLSDLSSSGGVVCASAYSIINDEECSAPFLAIRDPIGLRAVAGRITSPANYWRPALLETPGARQIAHVSQHDMDVSTAVDDVIPERWTIFGVGDGIGETPHLHPDQLDIVVVEDRVVAVQRGGGTKLPFSGLILSCPAVSNPGPVVARLRATSKVSWCLLGQAQLNDALQCGPSLVSGGEPVDIDRTMAAERLCAAPGQLPVAPNSLYRSAGATKAARSAVGLDPESRLILVVVEGTSTGSSWETDEVPFGATFDEVAEILCREGAVSAMAMDSGGSVGLYVETEALIDSGDFRGTAKVRHQRPLAHATLFY